MKPYLTLGALFATGLALVTWLEPWYQGWAGNRAASADIFKVALGDSRQMFARHFYVKADAYYHSGYYPSIYDRRSDDEIHMVAAAGLKEHDGDHQCVFLGKPLDWLDAFSRHFYPATHTHLGAEKTAPQHEHHDGDHADEDDPAAPAGREREMLPWLRLAASLDPGQPETYLVTAYWLRTRLGKPDEAARLLREGLQQNPGDYRLLFELGQLCYQDRKDPARARNLWELALRSWQEREAAKDKPDKFALIQMLANLATLEEKEGRYAQAAGYLRRLLAVTPFKTQIQKWLTDVEAKQKQ